MTGPTLQTAVAATMLLTAAAETTAQPSTPEIHLIEEAATGSGASAWIMRAPLPNTVDQIGLAMTCDNGVEITVFLGAFPPAGIPVQLAIRTSSGSVERFGNVIDHAGRHSGFHSPRLTDPNQVTRFLDAALKKDALVSNGYNSFWNRVAPERNRTVRTTLRTCGA